MDPRELRYLVDDTPQVLPTFGNVAATLPHDQAADRAVPRHRHRAEQGAARQRAGEVPAPLPPSGSAKAVTRFTDIWDKGKAAVIWSETTVTAPDGDAAVDAEAVDLRPRRRRIRRRARAVVVGRRAGPGARPRARVPILPQQALLYRLCGDRNPLHSDPEFAAAAGFPQPILHGLCTYGMTCKAITDALLDGDAAAVAAYGARFAGVAYPGETLQGQRLERRRPLRWPALSRLRATTPSCSAAWSWSRPSPLPRRACAPAARWSRTCTPSLTFGERGLLGRGE